ncbi:hypothetical protein NP493_249g05001 [Ridgeia piscesae]|uniref:Protein piccolo n=1 Tax=Ridgeia piscesae TaxID=27915 RepID=A0AAD9NYN9_RIDPI|nr:hypothetical protein NP493_249g05001 [Ridgeia piscesae]
MLLAQRERQRLAADAEAAAAKQRSNGARADRTTLVTQTKERSGFNAALNQNGATPSQQRVVSPHALPSRRVKHKRQISDPVVTKFSPIEEDRDVEHAMNAKMRADFDTVRRPEVRHVDATTRTVQTRNSPNVFVTQISKKPIPSSKLSTSLSRSSEVLHDYSIVERDARLMNSQSESCLPVTTPPQCRTPTFEERRKKERRKNELQQEIDKRKRQLEEAMLMAEANNVEPEVHDICFQHVRAADKAAAGIIKPIDYGPTEQEDYYSDLVYSEPNDEELSYSSTEYLAHKCERYPRATSHGHGYVPVEFLSDSEYDIQCRSRHSNQNLLTTVGSAPSPGCGYSAATHHAGMSGRLAANLSRPCDNDRFPVCGAVDQLADCEFAANLTDASTTPGSEAGPSAMPLLADVQHRSRTLVRNIGSRPLSDDLEKYYFAKDPLNTMYRADSDRSLGDSDENVMEGGVTIKQHVDQRPPAPTNRNRSKYDFPTKRILLTHDPKDRVVKGNTMGMRIVGGKLIPGGGGEVGAYVAAIYPGGVAEQLHGELREGDQVLEWNGITLTGKTFEEVQRTIAQPNGELELVVRPGAEMADQKHSSTMSTLCSDSCHSSYDNLDSVSDDNDYEHLPDTGVDLDPTKLSPGASVTSSQPDLDMTPSLSTSASSEQTDPASTDSPSDAAAKPHVTSRDPSVGRQQKQADAIPDSRQDTDFGDIQLQLSHDDYDGTLNVHVIQARNLQPKDKNGFSDPYVKVYLLPGRSPEKKRRTKYIARSLDPEWHQTLVFMNIPRAQLVSKTLEVTVWDYDRFKPNDFLGEVLIELSERRSLDNKPHWYQLRAHSDSTDFASRSPPPGGASLAPKSPSHKRDTKEKSPKNRRQTKRDPSPGVSLIYFGLACITLHLSANSLFIAGRSYIVTSVFGTVKPRFTVISEVQPPRSKSNPRTVPNCLHILHISEVSRSYKVTSLFA